MGDDPMRLYARFHAAANGLDPNSFEKQLDAESSFNPAAVSPKGARGVAQFMPTTGKQYGLNTSDDLHDPIKSIRAGAKYMADLKAQANGDERAARVGYNAGPGAMKRYQRGGSIPSETSGYINQVDDDPEALYKKFQSQLGSASTGAGAADGTAGSTSSFPPSRPLKSHEILAQQFESEKSRGDLESANKTAQQLQGLHGYSVRYDKDAQGTEWPSVQVPAPSTMSGREAFRRARAQFAPAIGMIRKFQQAQTMAQAAQQAQENREADQEEEMSMRSPSGSREAERLRQNRQNVTGETARYGKPLAQLQQEGAAYLNSLPQGDRRAALKQRAEEMGYPLSDEERRLAGVGFLDKALIDLGAPAMGMVGRTAAGIGAEAESIAPYIGYEGYQSDLKRLGRNLANQASAAENIAGGGPYEQFARGVIGVAPLLALPEGMVPLATQMYLDARGSGATHGEAIKQAAVSIAGLAGGGKLGRYLEENVGSAVGKYLARSAGLGMGLEASSVVSGEPQTPAAIGGRFGMAHIFAARGKPLEPTPESIETIRTQIEAMQEGRRPAVELTGQSIRPPIGIKTMRVKGSDWFYDPKQISANDLRTQVNDGTIHQRLGYVENKPQEGEPAATVVARDDAGREVQSAVVSPQAVPLQAEILATQHPESNVAVEPAANVIADRTITERAAIVPESQTAPVSPAEAPKVEPRAETLADLEPERTGPVVTLMGHIENAQPEDFPFVRATLENALGASQHSQRVRDIPSTRENIKDLRRALARLDEREAEQRRQAAATPGSGRGVSAVPLGTEAQPQISAAVPEVPGEAATERGNPSQAASVPFMITKAQRQQLYDLGHTRTEIDAMKPEEAQIKIAMGQRVESDQAPVVGKPTQDQLNRGEAQQPVYTATSRSELPADARVLEEVHGREGTTIRYTRDSDVGEASKGNFPQRFPVGSQVEYVQPGTISRKGRGEVVGHKPDPVTGDTFAEVRGSDGRIDYVGDTNDIREAPKVEASGKGPIATTPQEAARRYKPLAHDSVVDGRKIINTDSIPNLLSIDSSVDNPKVLPGIHEVPMSDFELTGQHYSVEGQKRIDSLAEQIKHSKEITPLIVVMDKEGAYILEGATRVDALYNLGAKSFPAKVVLDMDSFEESGQVAPAEAPKVETATPEWVQRNIDERNETAERAGVADQIEELSGQGKTARETANIVKGKLAADDLTDAITTVNSVRAKRGIPPMDDRTEFAVWRDARAARVEAGGKEPQGFPQSAEEFDYQQSSGDNVWVFHGEGTERHGGKSGELYVAAEPDVAANYAGPRGARGRLIAYEVPRSALRPSPDLQSRSGPKGGEEALKLNDATVSRSSVLREVDIGDANRFDRELKDPYTLLRESFTKPTEAKPAEMPNVETTSGSPEPVRPMATQPAPVTEPARTPDTMIEAIAQSSPSGSMSKRARTAAQERLSTALFGEGGLQKPEVPQPTESEALRRQAQELRGLAARGMKPKAYRAQADQLEARAAEVEAKPVPPIEPAKQPWEMGRAEYFRYSHKESASPLAFPEQDVAELVAHPEKLSDSMLGFIDNMRKNDIEAAIRDGKPVPPEVLADYPDLAKNAEPVHHSEFQPRSEIGEFAGPPENYIPKAEREAGETKERSLPSTLEEANLPGGQDRTYRIATNQSSLERAVKHIKTKGLDGAAEWVKAEREPSAEHTATAISVIKGLNDKADAVTDFVEADRLRSQSIDVASALSKRLTEAGQATQAVNVINALSPERALLVAQRMAENAKSRLTPTEAKVIKEVTERAQKAEAANSEAQKVIDDLMRQVGEGQKQKRSKREKLGNVQARLKSGADEALAELTRLGYVERSASASTAQLTQLAKYGAFKLAEKGISLADWTAHMVETFGDWIQPHLERIRRDSYALVKESQREAYLERAKEGPEERRTALQDIREEIQRGNTEEREARQNAARVRRGELTDTEQTQKAEAKQKAQEYQQTQKAERQTVASEARQKLAAARASLAATETNALGHGKTAEDARTRLANAHQAVKDSATVLRQAERDAKAVAQIQKGIADKSLAEDYDRQAREARKKTADTKAVESILAGLERKGQRESAAEAREKAKAATKWDANIKTDAFNAKKSTTPTVDDLTAIAAERMANSPGLNPNRFYREMSRDYGDAFTQNREAVYREAYQKVKDAREANRQLQTLRAATNGEYGAMTEEQVQAALARRVRTQREHRDARFAQAQEFTRLNWRLKTGKEKALAYAAAGFRAGVLSGAKVVGKIGSALGHRAIRTPIEEAIGTGWKHVFPDVADKAPTQGYGFSPKAEIEALKGYGQGTREIPELMKTGETELGQQLGKPSHPTIPTKAGTVLAMPGRVHASEKNPLRHAEYNRRITQYNDWAERHGLDPNDSGVKAEGEDLAWDSANEVVLMGDNPFSRALGRVERGWSDSARSISRIFQPVRKVPPNYLIQTIGEYGVGIERGVWRALRARNPDVLESMTHAEADKTMRLLKRGTVGLLYEIAAGTAGAAVFGGYYKRGRKEEEGKPKHGDIKLGPVNISHLFLHDPTDELGQVVATVRREMDDAAKNNKGKASKDWTSPARAMIGGTFTAGKGLARQLPFWGQGMQAYDAAESSKSAENFLGQIVASWVEPQLIREFGQVIDRQKNGQKTRLLWQGEQIKRSPQTFGERMQEGVPFWREKLPTKQPFQRMN